MIYAASVELQSWYEIAFVSLAPVRENQHEVVLCLCTQPHYLQIQNIQNRHISSRDFLHSWHQLTNQVACFLFLFFHLTVCCLHYSITCWWLGRGKSGHSAGLISVLSHPALHDHWSYAFNVATQHFSCSHSVLCWKLSYTLKGMTTSAVLDNFYWSSALKL